MRESLLPSTASHRHVHATPHSTSWDNVKACGLEITTGETTHVCGVPSGEEHYGHKCMSKKCGFRWAR